MNQDFVIEDGVLTLYQGQEEEVVIPEQVRAIGRGAFTDCRTVRRVIIPDSVLSVRLKSFTNCDRLESVRFGDGVEKIIMGTFFSCPGLSEIWLGKRVSEISPRGFIRCGSLRAIHASPDSTTYMSVNGVLYSRDGTVLVQYPPGKTESEYVIPEGVLRLGPGAVCHCGSLSSVTIPRSLSLISLGNFSDCGRLKEFRFDGSVSEFNEQMMDRADLQEYSVRCAGGRLEKTRTEAGTSFQIIDDEHHLILSSRDTVKRYAGEEETAVVPDGIRKIAGGAFRNCRTVKTVVLPDSVEEIGKFAFSGCDRLETVRIPEKVSGLLQGTFYGCSSLREAVLPGTKYFYGYTFYGCGRLASVAIPKAERIGKSTFDGCASLTDIHLPPSLRQICFRAFSGCSGLRGVTLPDGLEIIENDAFNGCAGLTRVTIPQSVQVIGRNVFFGCGGLSAESIALPDHLKHRARSLLKDPYGLDWAHRPWAFPEQEEIYRLECAERGFYTEAVWNLDEYIPHLLAEMLEILSYGHFGHPMDVGPEEWSRILKEMAAKFRNASELRGMDLPDGVLSSLIGQCLEKPQLQPALQTIPEGMVQGYLNGQLSEINNGQAVLNEFADKEMKDGFDMLKEYLWRLWD